MFCMSGLSTPEEIVKKQGQGKAAFDFQQVIDLYDGAVKSFDDMVGIIVDHVAKLGIADNTIIVIFSDHGTELFEQDGWGQGNTVVGDDHSLRIPMVIYDPRKKTSGVVSQTTRSVDVMPTLLDLVGIVKPASIDGVSLLPCVDDPQKDMGLKAFAETGIWLAKVPGIKEKHLTYPDILKMIEVKNKATGTLSVKSEYEDLVVRAKDRMVRNGRWKMVYMPMVDGPAFHLFNVRSTKNSINDVSKDFPAVYAELKQSLIDWLDADPKNNYIDGYVVKSAPDGSNN